MSLSLKEKRVLILQQLSVFALSVAGTSYLVLLYGDPKESLPKAHVLLSLFHILNQDLYKMVKYHTLRPFATGRGKKWLHNIILHTHTHTHTHPLSFSKESLSNLHQAQSRVYMYVCVCVCMYVCVYIYIYMK